MKNARSAFNPFSAQHPLRSFGSLKLDASGGLSFEGLPYVGPVVDYKENDPEEFRPQKQFRGCVAQFDLSKPEDMDQYRALAQKFCDKLAVHSFEERIYDDSIKSWRVLVRWMEPFFAAPAAAKEAAKAKPEAPRVLPDTVIPDVKDAAAVKAEEHGNGKKDRYATVAEAIHGFAFDSEDSDEDGEGGGG